MKLIIFNDFCEELEEIWNQLESSSHNYLFQSLEWLRFWQLTIGEKSLGIKLWIAVLIDCNGVPRAIFPLGIRSYFGVKLLEFLGGHNSDYLGPLIHDEWIEDPSAIKSAWELVRRALPSHDICHFIKIPAQFSAQANPFLEILPLEHQSNSYHSLLPGDFESFETRLRPRFRSDNRRQRKRLSEIGTLKFEIVCQESDWIVAINTLIEQKRERYIDTGVPDMLANYDVQRFYRHFPRSFSKESAIHLSVLKLDDEILAAHWGAVYRERFYFLMPTITKGKLRSYSPGKLLLEHLIEWSINSGLKVFDFTIGAEEYKKDWCESEMALFEYIRVVTPLGLPYLGYIKLRSKIRNNRIMWKLFKYLYSRINYGKQI